MPDIPYIGLPSFREVDLNYLQLLMKRTKKTFCHTDPFPMSEIAHEDKLVDLMQVIMKIVNLSLNH